MKKALIPALTIALAMSITGLCSCNQNAQEHKRKTLPLGNLTSLQGSGLAEDAFNPDYDGLETLFNSNVPAGYASVQLPDASKDGKIIDMVNAFKPTAIAYLENLAQQFNGVAIDLSSHQGETLITNFNLSQNGGFNLPVMVIWDQRNTVRFKQLQNLASGVPDLNLQYKSGDVPAGQMQSLMDCFNSDNK